nr:uncharacterized protein LOC108123669 isoform X1 [Drosophila bipectinata]
MAGPQVQHSQRPNSAYYTGLNGSSSGGASGGASAAGMATSASHTGLHALRQVSNETELIYRGSHSNGTVNELPSTAHHLLTGRLPQQKPQQQQQTQLPQRQQVSSIAGTGSSATDALINTITTGGGGGGGAGTSTGSTALALKKSNTQRSIEIIVDASQCGKELATTNNAGGSATALDGDDVEQGGGGQESSSSHRKSSRHRHRPLHRRLLSYLRNLFQGSTTQNDSELEEFETPARYRPDSLSALSRATRFTEDEIKRIYRGFKAECPTGVVKEDTFKVIYSQFFPQGANPTLYAHYVFNTLDQDHSGIVSFEDFVQGLSILSRGSVEEKLRWTFSLYDINGDGFITREEMTDIVTAIYELMGRLPDECPEEEKIKGKVEQIFQKMDINRDGVVTLEEFLEACRNDDAISGSMSYTVRRRRRSRSQQSSQNPRQDHHLKDPEKRKSNHKTKNKQQQQQQKQQQQQQQVRKARCCHMTLEMDGDESTTTGTTTTTTTTSTTSGTSAATGTTGILDCKLLNKRSNLYKGYKDEYDDDEEGDEEEDDDEDEDEEEYFVCRHCRRSQQYRSTKRSQSKSNTRRQRSKSKKRNTSSQRVKPQQQQHQLQQQQQQRQPHQQHGHQRWPEINAANEQAIRFRCPQVGPQVGRDLHTPQPMHFHHPLQSQSQTQTQSQFQEKIKAKTRSKTKRRGGGAAAGGGGHKSKAVAPPPPPPQPLPSVAPTSLPPLASNEHAPPLAPLTVNVMEPEAPQAEAETGAEQPLPTTPDSPSLVTVSTWYTVAKQGVSC